MNDEKTNKIIQTDELDNVLPKYEPIKLSGKNLAQQYVSAFNTGMNVYQCINQLQGYIEWVINSVNTLVKSWNDSVDETLQMSIKITKDTTTQQFNVEWENKQPELIEQVNTLTTKQFNKEFDVVESQINANLESQNIKIDKIQNKQDIKIDKIQNKQDILGNNIVTQNDKIDSIQSQQVDLTTEQTVLSKRMDTFTKLSSGSTTGDSELQDIRNWFDGEESDNAGSAVRGADKLIYDTATTVAHPLQIFAPQSKNKVYPLYIPKGQKFSIETLDGANFSSTGTLRLLRNDLTEISYYSFFDYINYRLLTNDTNEDIYYIKMNTNIDNSVKVTSISDNILSDIYNRLGSVTYEYRIFVPQSKNKIYQLYIPKGQKFSIETLDGVNFSSTGTLRMLRNDFSEIDYYSFFNDTNYRLLTNDTNENVYYIKMNTNIDNSVKVTSISNNILSDIYNRLDSVTTQEKIPKFYDEYLNERIKTVSNLDTIIGNNGDSFIFLSDMHDENNYYSPYMGKKICENTSVNNIIYGGDYINEPSSKEEAINLLQERFNKMNVTNYCQFLKGNHDTNPYGTGQLNTSEFYGIFDKKIEKYIDTNKLTYYYYDNKPQKIRYIYLDTNNVGSIQDQQLTWFSNIINELNENWTICVLMHMGLYTDTKNDRVNIKKFDGLVEIEKKLVNITPSVSCIICGHEHIDLYYTSGKYPIIAVTCDAHGVQASVKSDDNREANTINEQSFNVFHIDTLHKKVYMTRIGGGEKNVIETKNYTLNDRVFNYS